MIQTTVFNTTNKPNLKEKESVINFLFDNLQEYGDPKSDIEKCIDYALKETTSFGGFVLVSYLENEISGVVVVNQTGMKDYINGVKTGINHFRVGETLFIGTDVYNNKPFKKMHSDAFRLYSEIIELIEKPMVPEGNLSTNVEGEEFEFDPIHIGETSNRALIDIGLLDVDVNHLELVDKTIKIAGASSDMIVIDLIENRKKYKVGDLIEFKLDYMGTLRILNSKYIEKKIKNGS